MTGLSRLPWALVLIPTLFLSILVSLPLALKRGQTCMQDQAGNPLSGATGGKICCPVRVSAGIDGPNCCGSQEYS